MGFSYSCSAVDNILALTERRAVPLRKLSFLLEVTNFLITCDRQRSLHFNGQLDLFEQLIMAL